MNLSNVTIQIKPIFLKYEIKNAIANLSAESAIATQMLNYLKEYTNKDIKVYDRYLSTINNYYLLLNLDTVQSISLGLEDYQYIVDWSKGKHTYLEDTYKSFYKRYRKENCIFYDKALPTYLEMCAMFLPENKK